MNGIALPEINPLNGLLVAQSLTGFLRGFLMEEIWKPIPDCDGYLASSYGRIKNEKTGNIFSGHVDEKGYIRVSVIENGVRKYRNSSRLICRAFHGKDEESLVLHNNGNPADNRPENLRYGTARDNYFDSVKHGTNSKGIAHGLSKLKPEDIKIIREKYNNGGITYKQLGVMFGVTACAIYRVIKKDNWKWV